MIKSSKITPKERGLIKGALRRIFARSDIRQEVINRGRIEHRDALRPRVTKWSFCEECGVITPTYIITVDHVVPVIELHRTMEDMSIDELIDRIWCGIDNLKGICDSCHTTKTKAENLQRREFRKARDIASGKVKTKRKKSK